MRCHDMQLVFIPLMAQEGPENLGQKQTHLKQEPSISNEGQILCLILELTLRMVQGAFLFPQTLSFHCCN